MSALWRRLYKDRWAYFFVFPSVLAFAVLVALPLLQAFELSFYKADLVNRTWVGLGNYQKLLTDKVFHIELPALQIAGGILLLIIAIDHLIIGALRRSVTIHEDLGAYAVGCVPLACPILAGPGAMVTSLTTLENSGAVPALVAITTVFGLLWLIFKFIEPIHKILGKLFCLVFSKIMCLFIASIGVHMIMTGILSYFSQVSQ